jgi:hypothetical protein
LERLGAPVYLFLDNNAAGWAGTGKAIETLRRSLSVSILPYPDRLLEVEKAQPDDCTPDELLEQYQRVVPWYSI